MSTISSAQKKSTSKLTPVPKANGDRFLLSLALQVPPAASPESRLGKMLGRRV